MTKVTILTSLLSVDGKLTYEMAVVSLCGVCIIGCKNVVVRLLL